MQILAICMRFLSIFREWAQKYDFVGMNFWERRLQNLLNRENSYQGIFLPTNVPTRESIYQ